MSSPQVYPTIQVVPVVPGLGFLHNTLLPFASISICTSTLFGLFTLRCPCLYRELGIRLRSLGLFLHPDCKFTEQVYFILKVIKVYHHTLILQLFLLFYRTFNQILFASTQNYPNCYHHCLPHSLSYLVALLISEYLTHTLCPQSGTFGL